MPGLNTMLVLVVADLNRRLADATVTVKARVGEAKRVLHVVNGNLIAADSNEKPERLGDMLAGEGRLDPVLIEPVAAEARRRGTLLGDQLVVDGLLTGSEVAAALERQARLRFQNALACSGSVSIGPKVSAQAVAKLPLGAAVAVAFRERVLLEPIAALLEDRPRQPVTLDLESELFRRLELGPNALRLCRSLADGEKLETLLQATAARDGVQRMVGALAALGLWA